MRSLSVSLAAASLLALGACQRSSESVAPAVSTPAGAAILPMHAYQCGDLAVTATFDGVGAVDLSFPGGPLTLPQVESGSGARYADLQGNAFWRKGEEATFTLAGQDKRNCVPAASGS